MYLARVAALRGGLPVETSALTLNRLCGSGLQAILTAAQAIVHGDAQAAVAGGTESMSRAPYWMNGLRVRRRLNDTPSLHAMAGSSTGPFEEIRTGVTGENITRTTN